MKYKVTKEHFAYFKKRCEYWRNAFGLKNWHLEVYHHELDPPIVACTDANYSGYVATIYLAKTRTYPVKRDDLDRMALHEIIHLAHARYRAVAKSRFVSEEEIDEADEEVTRLLVNAIRRKD